MRELSLIIIDDEQPARELLRNILSDLSFINVIDEAGGVDEAIPKIESLNPDLILLDIQMPGKDGFMLIEKLLELNIQVNVVFVTAYEQYAIRAIKASAFDYLLKPVKRSELIDALERLAKKPDILSSEEQYKLLLSQFSGIERVKFRNRTGFSMVDPNDILFCIADSNYTNVCLQSGKNITVSVNLGKVEEMLSSDCFMRISRSAIINLKYLSRVDRKTMQCAIASDKSYELSVSRNYLKSIEEKCDDFFNGNSQNQHLK